MLDKLKKRMYAIVEVEEEAGSGKRIFDFFDIFILILIILNVISVIFETVKPIYFQYKQYFV